MKTEHTKIPFSAVHGRKHIRTVATGPGAFVRVLVACVPLALTGCAWVGTLVGNGSDASPSTTSAAGVIESETGTPAGSSTGGGSGPVEASSDASAGGGDSGTSSSAYGDTPNTGQTDGAPSIPDPDPGLANEPGSGPGSDSDDDDASDAGDSVSNSNSGG